MDLWAYANDVTVGSLRPGKPTDNAFIEVFKNFADYFDTIAENNLPRGVMKVIDRRIGKETMLANADAMIATGWLID